MAAQKQADINAKRAIQQQKIAEEQSALAIKNEAEAKKQTDVAVKAQKLAIENETAARIAEAKAQRERYLATAKAMALKSVEYRLVNALGIP